MESEAIDIMMIDETHLWYNNQVDLSGVVNSSSPRQGWYGRCATLRHMTMSVLTMKGHGP